MKRVLALALALLSLVAMTACRKKEDSGSKSSSSKPAARQESPFTILPESQFKEIPDYGKMAGVKPVREEKLAGGRIRVHYEKVSHQSYLDFGTLLNDSGYAIDQESYVIDGYTQTMDLIHDDVTVTVCYDQKALTLSVTYPGSTESGKQQNAKADPLAGYQEFPDNNLRILEVNSDAFCGSVRPLTVSGPHHVYKDTSYVAYILDVINKDSYNHVAGDLFSSFLLHYISSEGYYYQYELYCGEHIVLQPLVSTYVHINDLTSTDIPQAAWLDRDGTMAITFHFIPTDTDYILYIRRPDK